MKTRSDKIKMPKPVTSKEKKSFSELVTEKSLELFGFTPQEKSDQNLKWMLKNGYKIKTIRYKKSLYL
jgi:hypothetical protein